MNSFWSILCAGLLIGGILLIPVPHTDDLRGHGPWIVERFAAENRFQYLAVDTQSDDSVDWTTLLPWAYRFDDHDDATRAAAKLGGIVRPLRAVAGGRP